MAQLSIFELAHTNALTHNHVLVGEVGDCFVSHDILYVTITTAVCL